MRVKIGDSWYDANETPIMVELSTVDKKNILEMGESTRYCEYPKETRIDITRWIHE